MKRQSLVYLAPFVLLLAAACSHQVGPVSSPEDPAAGAPLTVFPPSDEGERVPGGDSLEPTVIDASKVPTIAEQPNRPQDVIRVPDRHPEMPISEEEAENLRAAAMFLPPNPNIQVIQSAPAPGGPASKAPSVSSGFESLNFGDDPSGTPPDPEVAVGPNHVIAVVNTSLEIYDKAGNTLVGPMTFGSFFSGVSGCSGLFDPNVLYDEKEDRFFTGIDSGGSGYCFAVTQTNDPTGMWNGYRFSTGSFFFDFPHAGIGEEAVFMGANIFNGGFVESRVWAIDKQAAYAGMTLPTPVVHVIGGDTPQPMQAQGFNQGTWPAAGPHYILTDAAFDGSTYGVWSWDDPFGADTLTMIGSTDLDTFTGVTAGFPLNFPQAGGANTMQGNDWRVQDAEYRNGSVWMAHTLACNPGGGTVNCVRWAEIDPTTATVLQAGVFSSDGDFRQFPNLAVNDAEDMVLGYTKSSTSIFPGVYVTGRLGSDPLNTVGSEVELKAGEVTYSGFDGSPHRWGDYSEAAADPDGQRLWYIGEYSEDTGLSTTWGNYVGELSFGIFADGFESGDTSAWSSTTP
jgi:hypothetical protein